MKVRWKRIRKTDREIYYFDSRQAEDTELCGRLLHRMIEEVRAEECRDGVVFLCIGTDRSTGDSLGPLLGYKLKDVYKRQGFMNIPDGVEDEGLPFN